MYSSITPINKIRELVVFRPHGFATFSGTRLQYFFSFADIKGEFMLLMKLEATSQSLEMKNREKTWCHQSELG